MVFLDNYLKSIKFFVKSFINVFDFGFKGCHLVFRDIFGGNGRFNEQVNPARGQKFTALLIEGIHPLENHR